MRILCLSFWTPPLIRPRSILIGKMVPEWLRQGLEPVIITYKKEKKWDIQAPLYEIPQFQPNKFFRKIPVFRFFLRKLYYQKLFSIARQVIKKHKLNLVFSFANPQDSNILGATLKKKFGIKFISYFSDPWFDNPYNSFSPRVAGRILGLERFIVQQSDRIIFTNQRAMDLVMKKYPSSWQEKARVIPPCYEPGTYPAVPNETRQDFVFSHIGAFYQQRNPELLLKALWSLKEKKIPLAKKFKLRLIGALNDYTDYSLKDLRRIIAKHHCQDIVEIMPGVCYEESLRLMKQSDCLIAIDANFSQSPFLPSKVIDYAGSGRTIIALTPKDSPTEQFLTQLGYRTFNYNEEGELERYLTDLINGKIRIIPNSHFLKRFTIQETTSQLIRQFREVLEL